MNRLQVLSIPKPKEKSLIEIKFDCDGLIELKYLEELKNQIKNPESIELKCERYESQLSKYKDNTPEFLTHANYSLKFLGDEEDLNKVLKIFQKLFPDYFIGLEKEK
ncbi:MAG: hypothetical protein QXP77_00845 [Candidatus Aenigmatarchaeota archaeon]